MKKLLASMMIVGALGAGIGTPTASAKPHDDWCHGCGGYDNWNNGWYPNWNNGWYPGQNVQVCATGPWRYVTVCF